MKNRSILTHQLKISISEIGSWVELIRNELRKEFSKAREIKFIRTDEKSSPLQREEKVIPWEIAASSAEIVGNIICTTKFENLKNKDIRQIFNWSDRDEVHVEEMRKSFHKAEKVLPSKASSNHIVAAAVMEASSNGADIEKLFQEMKLYLSMLKQSQK